MKSDEKLHIATVGKCVGLFGELKLHLHTDFAEQFHEGASFYADTVSKLEILSYNEQRGIVKFQNFPDRNSAARLVNTKIFTTVDESIKNCKLNEGEYFWFDLEDARVLEGDISLGRVLEIQRIANTDYLQVLTDDKLVDEGLAKKFLIPYIPTYIERFDKEAKIVYTIDAYGLLEAS